MYKAIRQVEITFPLGYGSPSAVVVEPGETFSVTTHGRGDDEWDVLVYDGEWYCHPRWKDIQIALENQDLIEL